MASAAFDPGWQSDLDISFTDLRWAATGERLTAESFARYRCMGGGVILHLIPAPALEAALPSRFALIARRRWSE
jgi:dihydroorotase